MQTNVWRMLPEKLNSISIQVSNRLYRIRTVAIVTTVLIYMQLALGATMRHQHKDLSILDFPTANGTWIPDTSASALTKINAWRDARGLSDVDSFQIWLQMTHRFVAVLLGVGVLWFALLLSQAPPGANILRRLSILWIAFFVLQFILGASVIWSNKAADVATAHVAVGAIMLSFGVTAWAISSRMLQQSRV